MVVLAKNAEEGFPGTPPTRFDSSRWNARHGYCALRRWLSRLAEKRTGSRILSLRGSHPLFLSLIQTRFFSSMIAERHEGLHETARERKIRPLIRNKEYITGYKLQLKTSERTTRRSKEVTTEKNKIKRVFVSRIGSQDKRNIPLLARSIIWKQEKVKGFFFLPF